MIFNNERQIESAYRIVANLISVPGKSLERIFIGDLRALKEKMLITCSQPEFTKITLSYTNFIFFFFPFFFWGSQLWHIEVPRLEVPVLQGSNQGCSCQPTPQPQQHQKRAASVTYTTACGNSGSLTHWAEPGMEPASSQIVPQVLNLWAKTETFFFLPR